MKKKPKKLSRGKLVKKLDAAFSQYIRLKYSNNKGYAQCYTCGDTLHYKNLQCGHFITRSNYKYRRDEGNCRPQCYCCNCIKSGNYKSYTIRMIDEIGREKVEEMIRDKSLGKISTPEIVERIQKFMLLVEQMLKHLE